MPNIAELKEGNRQRLHAALAVPAVYTKGGLTVADDPLGLRFTVRWHNKLTTTGALEGGFDSQIIDGINRLVFNQPQLTALGLALDYKGVVEVPSLGARFSLDTLEPGDGPVNVYWNVARLDDE